MNKNIYKRFFPRWKDDQFHLEIRFFFWRNVVNGTNFSINQPEVLALIIKPVYCQRDFDHTMYDKLIIN